MRVDPREYEAIDLRAHTLLAGVPLHDVWALDLPEGGPGRTVLDVRTVMSETRLQSVTPAVKLLFGLRGVMGRAFGWDRERARPPRDSFVSRLSDADRRASLVPPGTRDGPFWTVFVSPTESIGEIQNATVHGFSVIALVARPPGYRFYWAIYVRPVGRISRWYLGLIDPFRRLIIYPTILREIRRAWARAQAAA